jgi:hypothetical protein
MEHSLLRDLEDQVESLALAVTRHEELAAEVEAFLKQRLATPNAPDILPAAQALLEKVAEPLAGMRDL